jgi:exopolyphosphatase / guanosine-5'-triphosphate,3'-diphosphate pyrophosphatase
VTGPVAAVDIGTNSTNLLVVDADGTELERIVAITRLGRGVDQRRSLDPDAMARTLAQLTEYRRVMDGHGVTAARAVATSAARDARNRDEFFDRATEVLGFRPELLSGADEGRLAFAGATSGLRSDHWTDRPDAPWLVIDIGGGSTELMLGTDHPEQVISLDVGAVRLTEAELHGDPPRAEELSNAIGSVEDLLDDVVRQTPELLQSPRLVGIAGTITTVAAVEIGLASFEPSVLHGFVLTRHAAEDVFRTLATEPLADRIHNPGLPRERADVIVGGCCVLVAILRRLRADSLVVSAHNLLDGAAAELRPKLVNTR